MRISDWSSDVCSSDLKGRDVMNRRLASLDCPPVEERRCAHDDAAVAEAVRELAAAGCDILMMSGASAIVDRRDVLPAGLVAAGGRVPHFGMPVDPRSEERRGGQVCGSTCRSRWLPLMSKTKIKKPM